MLSILFVCIHVFMYINVCMFVVDASRAGEGQLEISVNHGEVPNQVEVLSSGKCIISFTPEKPDNHIVEIRYTI